MIEEDINSLTSVIVKCRRDVVSVDGVGLCTIDAKAKEKNVLVAQLVSFRHHPDRQGQDAARRYERRK